MQDRTMSPTDIAAALRAAVALGIEGRPCFPCRTDKRPATPHGFKEATSDINGLRDLWRRHPGPLVGVATGEASGIDALDIDAPRHMEVTAWWEAIRRRVPPTRIHATRSRGLHVLFRHRPGMHCWAGRPVAGIDGRGQGGYIIWWPAAGLPVISDAPLTPWPDWLICELKLRPVADPATPRKPPASLSDHTKVRYADAALRNATLRVAREAVGSRNDALNRESYGLGRLVAVGLLDGQTVADALAAAAIGAGLTPREVEATLRSAFAAQGLL
jgi:hypothetical protein